jgi:hypothetical protein
VIASTSAAMPSTMQSASPKRPAADPSPLSMPMSWDRQRKMPFISSPPICLGGRDLLNWPLVQAYELLVPPAFTVLPQAALASIRTLTSRGTTSLPTTLPTVTPMRKKSLQSPLPSAERRTTTRRGSSSSSGARNFHGQKVFCLKTADCIWCAAVLELRWTTERSCLPPSGTRSANTKGSGGLKLTMPCRASRRVTYIS